MASGSTPQRCHCYAAAPEIDMTPMTRPHPAAPKHNLPPPACFSERIAHLLAVLSFASLIRLICEILLCSSLVELALARRAPGAALAPAHWDVLLLSFKGRCTVVLPRFLGTPGLLLPTTALHPALNVVGRRLEGIIVKREESVT